MLLYCLKCSKNTESKNPKVASTIMLLSKCAVCDSKKSKFIKQQEASGLNSFSRSSIVSIVLNKLIQGIK